MLPLEVEALAGFYSVLGDFNELLFFMQCSAVNRVTALFVPVC